MNFGVLGGGFGIYGWLSALSYFSGIKIFTLYKYKEKLLKRHDIENLNSLIDKIKWFDNEDLLIKYAEVLIIARRPLDQVKVINKLLNQFWIGSLIIEKPT